MLDNFRVICCGISENCRKQKPDLFWRSYEVALSIGGLSSCTALERLLKQISAAKLCTSGCWELHAG